MNRTILGVVPSALYIGMAHAEQPVHFADQTLKAAVIDAGDPTGSVGREIAPNGLVINMGVYGAAEALKSN